MTQTVRCVKKDDIRRLHRNCPKAAVRIHELEIHMPLKSNAWFSLGSLIVFSTHLLCAEGRQTARPLPEYWFEDDSWHLEVQYIITGEELGRYRMETDRGRIYVTYGPPDRIDDHPSSFYQFRNYRTAGQPPLTFQFSVPPVDSCDGSYRITSKPLAIFGSDGHPLVRVYPGHFVSVLIPLVFSRTAAFSWRVRTRSGEPVLENDNPVLDGEYGPAPVGDSMALVLKHSYADDW
jgi:hypothetical protein